MNAGKARPRIMTMDENVGKHMARLETIGPDAAVPNALRSRLDGRNRRRHRTVSQDTD